MAIMLIKMQSVSDRVTSVVVSAVNTLKMNYFVNVAKIDAPSIERLDKFISACLSLYKTASKEGDDSGDDACILAVMALVKLDRSTQDTDPSRPYLIQAACLLENLRDDSPNNYKATLFLLLISQLLGLVSISLSAFQDLSLREIQYDTLSHLLYTRISTIHPFGSSIRSMKSLDDRHKDPLSGIEFALKWKPKAVGTFMNFMSKDVEKIQFDKILEFSQFKERLEKSFTKVLLKIEKRRIARLTNQTSLLEESLEHFRNATSDNRDFDVIPDFEYYEFVGMTKFGDQILTGSKPGVTISTPPC
jgi:N-terminal acetyltransferase B complex non-catalytic subunit